MFKAFQHCNVGISKKDGKSASVDAIHKTKMCNQLDQDQKTKVNTFGYTDQFQSPQTHTHTHIYIYIYILIYIYIYIYNIFC